VAADTDDTETPARKSKADRLAEVHQRARKRFDSIWSVVRDERQQALFDRRFATIRGAQWEGQGAPVDAEDEGNGSARMEVPKFLRPMRRVLGEYRASRKTVDFKPKGDDSDRGSADNLDGLYRADENDSIGGGQAAYDNAFQEAIKGGIGAWRLRARWDDESDEANDHQRISIDPIYDADQSVFFDLDAKHQDKTDARFGFVLFTMSRDAFEEKYPDESEASFAGPFGTDEGSFDWTRPDDLTLAEYFEVEDQSVLRRTFRQEVLDGVTLPDDAEPDEKTYDDRELTEEPDEGPTLETQLEQQGYKQVRQRRIKRQRVRKYLINGSVVLADEGYVPGQYIPVVPLYAERSYVDGIERSQGMVRPAIDSTRINNLVVSQLADAASGPSGATPIVAPEQVDNAILEQWAGRKINRPAVLVLKPIYNEDGSVAQSGLSGSIEPDSINEATAALMQIMGATVDELMGVNAAAETVPANTSAAAIELVQDRGDVNEFLWHDNFALALQCSGRIWLSAAKELYVEPGRKMISIDAEGKQSPVQIAEPNMDDGGEFKTTDLSSGSYDVVVDVGPATKTKRDATVKAMTGIAGAYTNAGDMPNASAALGVAVTNMEGEGTDGYRAFVRKQGLSAGWIEPNEQEAQALKAQQEEAGEQPDPNALIAQAAMVTAQAELKVAEVKEMEAKTRFITAQGNLKVAEAKAAATLASIPRDDARQILEEVRAETSSDRDDDRLSLDTARASTEFERHDRDMTQPGDGDGNAA
jgi:hypothetical protein